MNTSPKRSERENPYIKHQSGRENRVFWIARQSYQKQCFEWDCDCREEMPERKEKEKKKINLANPESES